VGVQLGSMGLDQTTKSFAVAALRASSNPASASDPGDPAAMVGDYIAILGDSPHASAFVAMNHAA
jgi:expansin (peptidoglycan-binding protein)